MIEVAAPAPPAEPTTPIRPSEALRLGRLLYPRRLEGWFWDGDGACAIGAIHAGGGLRGLTGGGMNDGTLGMCPACKMPFRRGRMVMHLNDDHHWSDDQIVAWLQGLGL